jgi:hypothetical protein
VVVEGEELSMSNDHRDCPKCKARMEEGFIVDYAYGWAKRVQSKWVGGAPVYSWWLGLNLRRKRAIYVVTYRCTTCGFLESYAK